VPSATDIVGDRDLRDLWEELGRDRGDGTFLICEDCEGARRSFTYGEFDRQIDRTANLLLEMGVQKGERVALQMHNCPEYLMILFGVAKIGAVLVPLNTRFLQEESRYVVERCQAAYLIAECCFLPFYVDGDGTTALATGEAGGYGPLGLRGIVGLGEGEVPVGIERFEEMLARQPEGLLERRPLSADDPVEILFTSGTTARPKGVVLTHCNFLFSGWYGQWQADFHRDDVMLTTMPACHSNLQLGALTPVLTCGGTLVMVKRYSAHRFWEQVRRYGATHIQCVSMMVRTMMMQPVAEGERDHRVRQVLYYLPITATEKEDFEARFGVRVMNMYGSTESICWVLTDLPEGPTNWPSVGRVGLSYQMAVVDDQGRTVPDGSIGEFVVHGVPGRNLMKCYFDDPEATAAAMTEDGWLHTGDKGYRDRDGWFFFVDRKADMIKRAGENISSTEVEDAIARCPKVEEAAVIGVPDPIRDQAVKAFVKPVAGAQLTPEEVREWCACHLASFKVPETVVIVDGFPRTSVGKIAKKLLS